MLKPRVDQCPDEDGQFPVAADLMSPVQVDFPETIDGQK